MTDKPNLTAPAIEKAYSRRQIIAVNAIGLASVAMARARTGPKQAAGETGDAKAITITKAIHQEEDFKARPQQIYDALLDAKQFSAFSGGRSAEIHGEVGGTFSLFAGHIVGLNVELVANHRIVQAWRVVTWPEGVYSIAAFELQEQGAGTRVLFSHTGFPPNLAEHLASGWQENYWKPLRKYVG